MQNYKIDNLVSIQQNNQNLIDGLELIKPRQTSGSLAAYDGFESEELLRFRKMFVMNWRIQLPAVNRFQAKY